MTERELYELLARCSPPQLDAITVKFSRCAITASSSGSLEQPA